MRILAISLDLDDTLWPLRPAIEQAEQALAQWLGEHAPRTSAWITPESRRRIRDEVLAAHPQRAHDVSFIRLEWLRRALVCAGDDASLAEPAFEAFLEARRRVRLYPDVAPVLERWALRYRLIAISNGNSDVAQAGIGHLFAASVSAHQLAFAKPDPRIYLEACRLAGVAPSAVLHIGDDLELDVRAAHGAGLRAVWLRRPDTAHRAEPDAADGTALGVFDSLHAVDAFLHPAQRDRTPGRVSPARLR